MNKKNSQSSRIVAIEIDSTQLHLCVSSRGEDDVSRCDTCSVDWRLEATSLNTERGQLELAEALRRIVVDNKLTGVPAWVSLTGSYCVTRSTTGEEERVREELSQMKERSELYLSLGHGPKALASSVYAVDARHRHGMLSVVNQRTLDTLVAAFGKSGLRLERIESSAVSLARLVGAMRDDAAAPALFVSTDERGVEVGISHRGQLMLDYRPASANNPEQIAATLLRHLGRLRRYCQRYIGITSGGLNDVYLLGMPETVTALRSALQSNGELTVHDMLDPWASLPNWETDANDSDWAMAVPLGAAMWQSEHAAAAPNLLEGLQAETREPLSHVLRPLLVPLAATAAAIALAWLGTWYQASRCGQLEREYAALELEVRDARLMQTKVMNDQQLLTSYQRIDGALTDPKWADISKHIAQCLPADTWLDSLTVDNEGGVQLSGGSYSEDGVFEFARWLANVPNLGNVAIGGTRPGRFPGGPGTQFDVHGEITKSTGREGHADDRS